MLSLPNVVLKSRNFWLDSAFSGEVYNVLDTSNKKRWNKNIKMSYSSSVNVNSVHSCNFAYLVWCFADSAMAYSATTVFPAEVCAATNTLSCDSMWIMACFWNGSSSNGHWRYKMDIPKTMHAYTTHKKFYICSMYIPQSQAVAPWFWILLLPCSSHLPLPNDVALQTSTDSQDCLQGPAWCTHLTVVLVHSPYYYPNFNPYSTLR